MYRIQWLVLLLYLFNGLVAAKQHSKTDGEAACIDSLNDWDLIENLYRDASDHPFLDLMPACELAYQENTNKIALASALCYGFYLQKDSIGAIPFCLKGYEAFPSLSATVLASIYIDGAKPEYLERARYWLDMDPHQEAVWTQRLLGQSLKKENPQEAMKWFALAAREGDVYSTIELAKLSPKTARYEQLGNALNMLLKQPNVGPEQLKKYLWDSINEAYDVGLDTMASLYDQNRDSFLQWETTTKVPWRSLLGMALAAQYAKAGHHTESLRRLNQLEISTDRLSLDNARYLLGSFFLKKLDKTQVSEETVLAYSQKLISHHAKLGRELEEETRDICMLLSNHYNVETIRQPSVCRKP